MKLARIGIIAAAILAVSSIAFAQKPDFSGTWTVDTSAMPAPATPPATPPAGTPPAGGGRGMAGPMTVKQTVDTLTVEQTRGETKTVAVYKLDGTESVNKMGPQGSEIEAKSTAKFDGPKLTIVTKRPGQDGAIQETTAVWTLDGGNLVIENTTARGTQKRVYKKTT